MIKYIDTGVKKTGVFILPYGCFILNCILPGAGFWAIGKTTKGFVNFFIAALLLLLNLFSKINYPIEGQFFRSYILIIFISGCAAFGEARNENMKNLQFVNLEMKQRKIQTFLCVLANFFSPGSGLLMLGKYWAGFLNFIMYSISFLFWLFLFKKFVYKIFTDVTHLKEEMIYTDDFNNFIILVFIFFILANFFCGRIARLMAKQIHENDKFKLPPKVPNDLSVDTKPPVIEKYSLIKKARSIHDLLTPFIAVFYNFCFPGAGYWYIGKWKAGFKHLGIFSIIFTLGAALSYPICIEADLEFSMLSVYIPLCILSGSGIFPLVQNFLNNINPKIKKIHTIFQSVFAPAINVSIPGSGFWLIGDIKAGVLNQLVLFLGTFIIAGVLNIKALNLEITTIYIAAYIFAGTTQLISSGVIIQTIIQSNKQLATG